MKLRRGRPDIGRYASRFAVPAARAESAVSVTFLGVATLLISDGSCAIMTDGFFSRPSLLQVAATKLTPNRARIEACLARAGVQRLDAVVPVHSHYDHAQDSAVLASLTNAVLVGGESILNIGRGAGLAPERMITAGAELCIGAFDITHIASRHCPPDRFPGMITEPLCTPTRVSSYRCGEAWSVFVAHRTSGRRMLIQGSAGLVPGALAGQQADVVYLGVGQLGLRPESEIGQYWEETVRGVGARRVVLIHWDDFFRPLEKTLRAVSYAVDDLDETIRIFDGLAARDGVELLFPTVWRAEDPWL
jgi:L-ascorbate metabolism protein UlaG (beta-lactamase superfamily)